MASGLAILVGGLVPAVYGSWRKIDRALRSGTRSATDGPAARRVRRALVAGQFALATPLLVAALLVLVSLDRLSRVDRRARNGARAHGRRVALGARLW